MSRFWFNWLVVWCLGAIVFGVVLASAAAPSLDGVARTVFVLFADGAADAATFDLPAVRFGLGLQGALTIGWSLTMLVLLDAARSANARHWVGFTLAVAAWYVIDSAISIATGFWINAVSNSVIFVGFIIPMIASGVLRREPAR